MRTGPLTALMPLLLLLLLLRLDGASAQCPDANWTHRGRSCYKWFSDPIYWFEAEQTCISHRGHLASIGYEKENRLVGRLSHCTHAWIGRFGTQLDRLTDPRTYRWTDGSDAVSFERHNFSELDSVHRPLIRTDGEWWLNSLYHERHPFVCESAESHHHNQQCPSGWTLHDRSCYLMPQFEADFNEANFYCQRSSSHLVSVLSESELRFINRLTFGIDGCEPQSQQLDSVWLGLIKLNPCFPDRAGRELCYQWTDFSGKLGAGTVPAWEDGHPNKADWTVNCVTLSAGRLRSDRCHSRHRFVCKASASDNTDGGAATLTPTATRQTEVGGFEAAFDFRRSLDNLVDPSKYVIKDPFGVRRSAENGACFQVNETYIVGDRIPYNESILASEKWTMYFRMNNRNSSNNSSRSFFASFLGFEPSGSSAGSTLLAYMFERGSTIWTGVYEKKPVNSSILWYSYINYYFSGSPCFNSWCDFQLAERRNQLNVTIDGNLQTQGASPRNFFNGRFDVQLQQIQIGHFSRKPNWPPEICIRCFGVARRHFSEEEMGEAMSALCPADIV